MIGGLTIFNAVDGSRRGAESAEEFMELDKQLLTYLRLTNLHLIP